MSERNVKLFYNEMCKNEKLQNEIQEVLGGANTESDKQAILNNIAKKYHFDFTPEEAKKFAENLSRNELSLDDLIDVSGGIGRRTAAIAFTALTALGSLGSAGAIVSRAAPQNCSSNSTENKTEYLKLAESEIMKLFNTADDDSASRPNLTTNILNYFGLNKTNKEPKIDDLAHNLKKLYENSDYQYASQFVRNLFNNSDYNWHRKVENNCSYYLLKKKDSKKYLESIKDIEDNNNNNKGNDYCLALNLSRKVIYYKTVLNTINKETYATDYLKDSKLEKELHQRRLFRNALLNICANTNDQTTMGKWANDLIQEILPDAEYQMKCEHYYR